MRYTVILLSILIFISQPAVAQPSNDNCSSAQQLCYDEPFSATLTAATAECGGADGDCLSSGTWGMCYDVDQSVWFSFMTNASGGDVNVTLSAINCAGSAAPEAVLISATTPCDPSTYTSLACMPTGGTSLSVTGLMPSTTYYIQVDGSGPGADCDFTINLIGSAVETAVAVTSDTVDCMTSAAVITVEEVDWGTPSYTYAIDNNPPQGGNVFSEQTSGTHSIAVTDASGCSAVVYYQVPEKNNDLEADAGPDMTTVAGNAVSLQGSGNGNWHQWNLEGIGVSDENPATFPAVAPGVYIMHFSTWSNEGCSATDSMILTVVPELVIYNAITPNGDGLNDRWIIRNAEYYPALEVNVFSRWGQKVFSSKGYDNDAGAFAGEFAGKALPAGVYYYVIERNLQEGDDASKEAITGPLTIMR